MITLQQWDSMESKEKTIWLEDNFRINKASLAQRKPVLGVGINDSNYCTQPKVEGFQVRCPCYIAWRGILKRSYDANYHEFKQTYLGVTVCNEWRNFSAFRAWWMEHQVDGWQIDKDILSDAMVYSPDTCLFVPRWLNMLTVDHGAARGDFPIGVCFNKSRRVFQAYCNNPLTMKKEHLGCFGNPEPAHIAWRTRKLELALELKPKMDEIDLRIYPRVVEIINNAK